MKKLLLATVAVRALCGSAMAFGNDYPVSGNQSPPNQPGITALVCSPQNDRRCDDVKWTDVVLNLDRNGNAVSINAIHHLYDGRVRDRGNQYSDDGVQTKAGYYEWYWSGRLFSNPQLTMAGRLYFNSRTGWFYEEHIWKHGMQEYVSSAPCNVISN
jgi:hypothetical protein